MTTRSKLLFSVCGFALIGCVFFTMSKCNEIERRAFELQEDERVNRQYDSIMNEIENETAYL
jgi:hypothetical protein